MFPWPHANNHDFLLFTLTRPYKIAPLHLIVYEIALNLIIVYLWRYDQKTKHFENKRSKLK